jgi:hypothetical protein
VANNSTYRVTFERANNLYYTHHVGSNNLLDVLPPWPFRQQDDPPDRQTTILSLLPIPQPGVQLAAIVRINGVAQAVNDVDFLPLGGTQSQSPTVVWLSCAAGNDQRFISVTVDPVTGLAEIGPLQTELPPGID